MKSGFINNYGALTGLRQIANLARASQSTWEGIINRRSFVCTAGLLVVAPAVSGCAHLRSDWITLIDGEKGLDNFTRAGNANWRAEGGAIVADEGTGNDNYLVSKNAYKDFKIYAEFWADHTTNSGILIRASDPTKIDAENAYEVNIFDQRPDPEYGTGGIVNFAVVNPMPKAGGKWNAYEIYAKGSEVTVRLNGAVTVSMQDNKFASGPFALQFGSGLKNTTGGVIKWRKVKIREL